MASLPGAPSPTSLDRDLDSDLYYELNPHTLASALFLTTSYPILPTSANMTSSDPAGLDLANGSLAGETRFVGNSACEEMQKESEMWSTICEGYISVIVGICGLLGNGATMAVLSRPGFKETFHKLLVCLAVFDSLFIGEFCTLTNAFVHLTRRRRNLGFAFRSTFTTRIE